MRIVVKQCKITDKTTMPESRYDAWVVLIYKKLPPRPYDMHDPALYYVFTLAEVIDRLTKELNAYEKTSIDVVQSQ